MGKAVKKKTEGDFVKVHPEAKRHLLKEAWQSESPQATLYVFEYLCTKIDYDGIAEITVEEITEFYGMSRPSVDRALQFLKEHGYIEVLKFGTKIKGVRFLERTAESIVAHVRDSLKIDSLYVMENANGEDTDSETPEKALETVETSPATLPVAGFVVSKGCSRPKPPAAGGKAITYSAPARRPDRYAPDADKRQHALPLNVAEKPQRQWTVNPLTGRPEIDGRPIG